MLTYGELGWVLEEIAPLAVGAIVQKVWESGERGVVLQLRRPGRTLLLLLALHPRFGRAHLIAKKPRQGAHPGGLTMLLRKRLQGAIVRDVSLAEGDRILTIGLDVVDPEWVPDVPDEELIEEAPRTPVPRVRHQLIVEWCGRATNLFLCDQAGEIVGQQAADVLRGLAAGQPWAAPEPTAQTQTVRFDVVDEGEMARSAAIHAVFADAEADEHAREAREALGAALRQQLKRQRRLIGNLERDLERVEEAERYKVYGELLQGAHGKIPRGAASAMVVNYYDPELAEVEVPLDPSRGLQENIARYFKQYRRMHDAANRIEERLLEELERQERLEQAQAWLLGGARELDEVEARQAALLEVKDLVPTRPQAPPRRRGEAPKQRAYREFVASSGAAIYVGRSSAANDELSVRIARGRDMWLHARDWAGSHVLLRMDRDGEPGQADLWDAATLAAHFSKGKGATRVEVMYTRAKFVRKPKGYPVGMVTVAGGSSLAVKIDEEKLARLMGTERA
jgi:predicted ribosome quality control (RQC) complex YloA/Tae2 family protein